MENSEQPESASRAKGFGAFAYGTSIYFIAIATTYLWAYWSKFSVNILEYLAVTDVLKHAAFPIASAVLSVAIGVALGSVFGTDTLPPGGGKATPVGRVLKKYKKTIFLVGMVVVLVLYIFKPPQYFSIGPTLAGLLLAIPLGNLPQVQRLFPDNIRYAVVFFLSALPLLAFGIGDSRADAIVDGSRFHFLMDPALEPSASLRYIGHAGEEYFFYEPRAKAVVLMKRPTDKPLMFSPFKRK